MEPSAITQLVDSLGLPAAIIIVMVLTVWRGFRWTAPRAEKLFNAHIELVEDLRTQNASTNTEILAVAKETLSLVRETRNTQ